MKKCELIDNVSRVSGQPKVAVRSVLDATCDVVHVAIAQGDAVSLAGLGKMSVVKRGEKMARNIHTGEKVLVPARKAVRFEPSVGLVKAANAK